MSNILSNLDITLTDSILILIKIIINCIKSSLDNQTHEIQIEEIKTPDFYFTVAGLKRNTAYFYTNRDSGNYHPPNDSTGRCKEIQLFKINDRKLQHSYSHDKILWFIK